MKNCRLDSMPYLVQWFCHALTIFIILCSGVWSNASFADHQADTDGPTPIKLALFIPAETEFWTRLSEFTKKASQDLGVTLHVFNAQESQEKLLKDAQHAIELGVRGIIFPAIGNNNVEVDLLTLAERHQVKSVMINTPSSDSSLLPQVQFKEWLATITPNDMVAGRSLIRKLITAPERKAKQSKILAFSGQLDTQPALAREQGLLQYLSTHQGHELVAIEHVNWSPQEAVIRYREIAKTHPDIDIIWSASDAMARALADEVAKQPLTKKPLIGGIDWDPSTQQYIDDGRIYTSVGGHFLEGAWAVVLLYDHLHGIDFSDLRLSYTTGMSSVDAQSSVMRQAMLSITPEQMHFSPLSLALNRNLFDYDMSLRNTTSAFSKFAQNYDLPLNHKQQLWLAQHPTIKIGVNSNLAPISFLGEEGQLQGITIELLNLIDKRIAGRFEIIEKDSFVALQQSIQSGEIDAATDFLANQTSAQYYIFTQPYLATPFTVVARKADNNTLSALSLSQLTGKVLALEQGVATADFIARHYPQIKVKLYYNTHAALQAVINKQADFYLGNKNVADYLFQRYGLTELGHVSSIKIPTPKASIAVRKDLPDLAIILNQAIGAISPQEKQLLQQRWNKTNEVITTQAQRQNTSLSSQVSDSVLLLVIFVAVLVFLFLLLHYLLKRDGEVGSLFESTKLRSFGLISIAVVVSSIILLTTNSLDEQKKLSKKVIDETLSAILASSHQGLSTWVKTRQEELHILAQDYNLIQHTEALTKQGKGRPLKQYFDYLRSIPTTGLQTIEFFVMDTSQRMIYGDNTQLLAPEHDLEQLLRPYLGQVDQRNAIFVAPQKFENGEKRMFFIAKLRNMKQQELGFLIMAVPAEDIFSQLLAFGRIGETGETYAFNPQSFMLSESRFVEELNLLGILTDNEQSSVLNTRLVVPSQNQEAPAQLTFMASQALKGESGVSTDPMPDYRGKNVYSAWLWDHELGLGLATEINEEEAISNNQAYQTTLISIVTISIALCLSLTVFTFWLGARTSRILLRNQDQLAEQVSQKTQQYNDARDAAEKSAKQANIILESANDGIIGLDNKGNIRFINPAGAELLAYTVEQLLNKNLHHTVHCNEGQHPHPEDHCQILTAIINNQKKMVDDDVFWSQQQRPIPVEYTVMPSSEEHAGIAAVVVFRDISDRREYEDVLINAKDEAEQAARVKANFLANMSHEIRTPMNAIIGMSHLALGTELDNKQRNYINKVHHSAESLLGIINDILDFSKIEAGKLNMEQVPFQLEDIMMQLSNLVALKAAEKQLEIIFDIEPNVPNSLIGDPLRLSQVLTNLTNNAVKFTEPHGEVLVHVQCQQPPENKAEVQLQFMVQDSGIGIANDKCQHLFTSFNQADASTTRKYGGTGLGLAISKQITQLMQGDIWVESELGTGSKFYFTGVFGLAKEQPARPQSDITTLDVIVIDDHQSVLTALGKQLTVLGFQYETFTHPEQALIYMANTPPTNPLLLLDSGLPGNNCFEVAQEIAHLHGQHLPTVIMANQYLHADIIEPAAAIGIGQIINKPVTLSSLLDSILLAHGKEGMQYQVGGNNLSLSQQFAALAGAHVLLVEDNEINQELAVELLAKYGMTTAVANHGQHAIDLLAEDSFDGILMDCQMPVMDGYSATKIIRQQTQYAQLPIIAMTANVMAHDKEKALASGMNDHIAKPININDMLTTLSKWIVPRHPIEVAPLAPQHKLAQADENTLWLNIPGVDTAYGLGVCQQDKSLYQKILSKFCQNEVDFSVKFNQAKQSSRDDMVRCAHTLKGLAGNIGAKSLQRMADKLEHALLENEAYDALLQDCDSELQHVISAINACLPQPVMSVEATLTAPEVEQKLTLLRQLLADDDTGAIDIIDELSPSLQQAELTQALTEIQQYCNQYEFDEALVSLEKLLTLKEQYG
ncbi:response regulator [Motilimonas pumila]|uniref:Sensory/regulatory protein RpfC n=1 Tax=Motilimonas pumila TaxID=2303987 RepID=A0A418YEN1_9GAMM|nr:response regulator [Motilimonas pumila]RJG47623.1 response regulator [Motilimonas pumila]